MQNDNKIDLDSITIDDFFIEEAFDKFESKDVMEMYWTINKYKIISEKLKEPKNIVNLMNAFPKKEEREAVKDSRDYLKDKGVKFSITRQKYRSVIKEYIDYATPIYEKKKEEAFIIRREKEKEKAKQTRLCSCGAFITNSNYARHLQTKRHKLSCFKKEEEEV
jgi:hypothetical protein